MIKTDTIINFPNKLWGEDRLCVSQNMFCVIDGATPITSTPFEKYHSNAEWMADSLAEYIQSHTYTSESFPLICRNFISKAINVFDNIFEKNNLPCLTTAALQFKNKQLICWVIGDCSIYLLMKNGKIVHITDKRVTKFSQKTLQAKEIAISRGEDPKAAILAQRIQNKKMMNASGGYWTVGFYGNFEDEFTVYNADVDQIYSALLCTDGLDRLFSHHIVNPKDLLTQKISLNEALNVLREHENSGKITEIKQHDDVAAILLKSQ